MIDTTALPQLLTQIMVAITAIPGIIGIVFLAWCKITKVI